MDVIHLALHTNECLIFRFLLNIESQNMKKGRIMYNYLSLKIDLANTDNGVAKVSLLTTKFTS